MSPHPKKPLTSASALLLSLSLVTAACGGSVDTLQVPPTTVRALATSAPPVSEVPATDSTDPAPDPGDFPLEEIVGEFVGSSSGGIDVLVRRNGAITRATVGEHSTGIPLVPGAPFRVGSISKTFVATMVLQLVDEGSVNLDEPISTYLPTATTGASATVQELLSHTSGLPNYTDQPDFFADALADPQREFTPDEVLHYVASIPAKPPGQFAYSNTNYILLGQLVEAIDGGRLNSSLARRVTEPLGLSATYFATAEQPASDDLVAGWADGLLVGDPDTPYASISSGAWAAGALVSTTDDLFAFVEALASGALMTPESLAAMTDPSLGEYGFGLLLTPLPNGHTAYAHSGAIPGYHSTMAIDSENGDIIIVLANNDSLVADDVVIQLLLRW